MLAEKCLAQKIARDRGELLFLVADAGELHFLFPRDGFLRHGRMQQDVA